MDNKYIRKTLRYWSVLVCSALLLFSGCSDDDGGGPECGNGQIDAQEECDGSNLGGRVCTDVGNYVGGTLSCTGQCWFDTSQCTPPANCGNGQIDTGEECDGSNLNNQTCSDVGNYTGGTLACNNDCTFDVSQCTSSGNCGNGQIDSGEECDGSNLNNQTCSDVGSYTGGTLSCNDDCSFNVSQCTSDAFCPNVILDSSTSVTYNGDSTGGINLVTSPRLEWTDAPDDALSFTAPEAGDYEIVVTAEPSSNAGCGPSVWDYGTDSFYDASWCPQPGNTTEIDGFYSSAGYPHTFTQGQTVIIWFSCTYWADVQYGAYTLTIQKQ